MEILQLQYFCTAAETENFAEAGSLMNVPASSISQSVRRLEKELGVDLFDRKANSIELNQRGRAFYIQTKSGLNMLRDAKTKAMDVPLRLRYQSAASVAEVALAKYSAGEYTDDAGLKVTYLRPSQAERELKEKQKNAEK